MRDPGRPHGGRRTGRLLEALAQHPRLVSKVVVVIDDDIPIRDANAINWAISFRSQPHRDFQIVPATQLSLDPSLVAVEERGIAQFERLKASALLIDATRKWAYPPLSLPGARVHGASAHPLGRARPGAAAAQRAVVRLLAGRLAGGGPGGIGARRPGRLRRRRRAPPPRVATRSRCWPNCEK